MRHRSPSKARHRFKPQPDSQDQRRAEQRQRDAEQAFRRAVRERLRETVVALGGPNAAQRQTRVSKSVIVGWHAGESLKSSPTLKNAWKLGLAADVSLDWLCGFEVPRKRSDRERIGALLPALRGEVGRRLADELGTTPEFVEALLPTAEQLLGDVLDRYRERIRSTLERKRRLEDREERLRGATIADIMGYGQGPHPLQAKLDKEEATLEALRKYMYDAELREHAELARLPSSRTRQQVSPAPRQSADLPETGGASSTRSATTLGPPPPFRRRQS